MTTALFREASCFYLELPTMENVRVPLVIGDLTIASCVGLFCVLFWMCINYRSSRISRQNEPKRQKYGLGNLPPVFPNGWIPVLESVELRVNEVKRLGVIGMELVAFRTEDGVAHVMDGYCPHLGAHLGVMGRVVGDCIECPFHGWRFRGKDGACTYVPYASKTPEFAKAKTWLSREMLSFIFIWYHSDGEEPSWELEDDPEITTGQFKQTSRFERLVSGHIQDISENAADIGHLNVIHKASTFVTHEEYVKNTGHSWKGRLVSYRYDASWSAQGTTARTELCIHPSIMGWELDSLGANGCFKVLGPALVVFSAVNSSGRIKTVMAMTPVGPLQVRVVHLTFSEPRMPWLLRKFIEVGNRRMMDRDITVWNNKTIIGKPLLVKEDRFIADFRKWYSQFYSSKSPTWQEVKETTLDW
ncbi:hypothetical protein ISCGN_014648 [Ixodes scapularis]